MPSHPDDVARAAALARRGQVPLGGAGGFVLTKNSPDDYDIAWAPSPAREIKLYRGNPNTILACDFEGQLCCDVKNHTLYQNTDGIRGWAIIGGGGGGASTFPVGPLDDGTYTGEVDFGTVFGSPIPGALSITAVQNSNPSNNSFVAVFANAVGGVGAELRSSVGDVNVQSTNGDVVLAASGAVDFNSAVVVMGSLPTADPVNAGQLYMVGYVAGVTPGTMMVSAG